ncbi:type II toxin-antitoxin system RelB/DinJ family antitoxin [Sulfurovum sp.]|uniref:type II toxin-antitoxin system RelB/DinJ family antitoxin n=1 Tax=Sulfurovum sp. TaxID=1969726 RepID=UPI0017679A84|nr:type II toxin-antitoxin system RelB/DinJ family antitoxin [Sulfurovum sp.]HHH37210.1 type II toxin-antitoxin system RelB/DinJ family antitoxin [Campylobacterota bacterium]
MLARKQTSIKVDPRAWNEAKDIFKKYNLTVSDAINIFLNKVRLKKGMPFDVKLPQKNGSSYIDELRKRDISIDKDIDVDVVINEMNDGLS